MNILEMSNEFNFVFLCFRENKVACTCDSHFSCGGRKSSCHYRDVFDNKTVLCIRLLPKGQNCSYVVENPRPDLHTRDQLDFDDLVLGYYWWLSRHETNGECIRYTLRTTRGYGCLMIFHE